MVINERGDLARLIKGAAALRGMTAAALAQALGVGRPSMSRTINKSDISISDLQRIAAAMGAALVIDFVDIDK